MTCRSGLQTAIFARADRDRALGERSYIGWRSLLARRSGLQTATFAAVLALGLLHGTVAHADAIQAGEIIYYRGAVGVNTSSGAVRLLGSQSPVYVGDAISTSSEGFAILKLADQSRVLLRPGSVAAVTTEKNVELKQGGVRATFPEDSTVVLSHGSVRLTAPGAEVVARLCTVDCGLEANAGGKRVATPASTVVARAALVVGNVEKVNAKGERSPVAVGSSFAVGEAVTTHEKSFVAIVFTDGGRVSVEPKSQYTIEAYQENTADPTQERMQSRLNRGGARVMTGGIAHRRAESFRMETPIALIGVRGTGFDVLESKKCGATQPKTGSALTASVWQGVIGLLDQNADVKAGETVCVPEENAPIVRNVPVPSLQSTRPDAVQVPPDLFTTTAQSGSEEGLHVSVIDGDGTLTDGNRTLQLGSGEEGFSNESAPIRVTSEVSPGFSDPYGELQLQSSDSVFDQFVPNLGVNCPAP